MLKVGESGNFAELRRGDFFRLRHYTNDVLQKVSDKEARWFTGSPTTTADIVWLKESYIDKRFLTDCPIVRIRKPSCEEYKRLAAMLEEQSA